jgi:predicted nucleic acid-binding protein
LKVYVDTNVIVAALVEGHSHHVPARDLMTAVWRGDLRATISTHGMAEFYSVLTKTPFSPRIHPIAANRLLEESIYPFIETVGYTEDDYRAVIANIANAGHLGGMVFDALHLWAAQKADCDRIYTFNVRHFRMLAPEEQARKITMP